MVGHLTISRSASKRQISSFRFTDRWRTPFFLGIGRAQRSGGFAAAQPGQWCGTGCIGPTQHRPRPVVERDSTERQARTCRVPSPTAPDHSDTSPGGPCGTRRVSESRARRRDGRSSEVPRVRQRPTHCIGRSWCELRERRSARSSFRVKGAVRTATRSRRSSWSCALHDAGRRGFARSPVYRVGNGPCRRALRDADVCRLSFDPLCRRFGAVATASGSARLPW